MTSLCYARDRWATEGLFPMKKLLFVDDMPDTLTLLRESLDPMRQEWDMAFAESGQEALAALKRNPVDVVVSDLVMPGMDGVQLLGEVRKQYPHTVRIAFSGQTGQEASLRSAGVAHQFVAKPFTPAELKALIDRTCALRDLLNSESLRQLVAGIKTLPSLPTVYRELMAEMQSPDPSIKKAARLVAKDMAMATKMLQMVNSAFFGLRSQASNPEQAVLLLGLDTVKSLVLSLQVFAQFEDSQSFFSLDALWRHALTASAYARLIAQEEHAAPTVVEDAFAAALLHDVGTLVLATNLPEQFAATLAFQQNDGLTEWDAERQVLGATHAEIGAYLLGIWGLSDPLVEAVAFHHTPMMCVNQEFTPLTGVHVADAFEQEDRSEDLEGEKPLLDETYLAQCGFTDRIPRWRAVCRAVTQKG